MESYSHKQADWQTDLSQPEGRAALRDYFSHCIELLETDSAAELPDPAESLGHFAPAGSRLTAHSSVVHLGAEPARMVCPDGSQGHCWREQREKHGRVYWVWVCNCL
jgi:hypothetical protein